MSTPKDNDENLYGPSKDDDDADIREIIETALKNSEADGDDDDDAGGFGAPIKREAGDATVSHEQGLDLIDKTKFAAAQTDKAEPAADAEKKEEAAPQAGDETRPEAETGAKQEGAKPAADPAADLLADIPEERRAIIADRLDAATRVMSVFKGHEAELQRHNVTPEKAMERLVYLNAFAQEKPDEYIAWVAGEMKPDAAHEVLGAAAKLIGYKLVPEVEESQDEFEDEEIRKLREENARLKAGTARAFGPDAPERVAQRTISEQIAAFATEKDEAGTLKRPYFDALRPQISAAASAMRAQTGQPVTVAQLDEIYRKAEDDALKAFGITSAAQKPAPVAAQEQDKKAADLAKAKAASTSIDGSGQGADRHPALSPDAPIADVVRHFAGKMIG